MDKVKVAVTGLGIVNSAGLNVEESWANVLQGNPMAKIDERLDGLSVNWSCPIVGFNERSSIDPKLMWRIDKFVQYLLEASNEAIADSQLDINESYSKGTRVGVVVGNSLGGVETLEKSHSKFLEKGESGAKASMIPAVMGNMGAAQIACLLGIKGPVITINTACASGGDSIGIAKNLIETGKCDSVIVGCSEAPITPLIVSSFNRLRALSTNSDLKHSSRPFDQERDGFVISEGAGVLIVENEKMAKARNAFIYGYISGYGTSNDAYHVTTPAPEGDGLKRAVQMALEDAGLSANKIDSINAHGTSTHLNDETEGIVFKSIFPHRPVVTSTKGVTGHSLGATGAVEAIYSVLSLSQQRIPMVSGLVNPDSSIDLNLATETIDRAHIRNILSSSVGFGGQNSVIIFSKK
ncbi:beta-ketoacyl-[acyl-carrier-protein] synthase family protein [Vibrio spartinae]|uniref:3-oxoacyl-[acyl-carrier-protein] synthase 2 n=1 Tax=Vibrio spartinae TaxID=1918945 RepID=A0A1N6M974_9VIBR|nr:beta-ketoacyl-[acyl-carrier-protein] synthase family protein [Vibrio spartinae]QMV16249.1 3-oxoacyl-[acyl-carrier-protein] synthase 2 [Vibrio spartinae]SIO95906.1 3-oxoacyl-[acyl-carrier-protein] synthase 2 [Vibrio spartinae]